MTEPTGDLPTHFALDLPPELAGGAHADAAFVWHTAESFVIDFIALKQLPHPGETPEGTPALVAEALVTSRVRMAPTHVIELMKVLERQLSRWETDNGHRPPVDPPHPDAP